MKHIKYTKSICPECLQVIPASIYEEGGKVYIKKTCSEHGEFNEIYWSDYNQYRRAEKYNNHGKIMKNSRTEENKGCPQDCGICPNHKSTTTLGIIDVTNRCNLRCPICFAHSGATGYLYEPSKEKIGIMVQNLLDNDPVVVPALQFSGGEPTVRDDLPELVKMAKDMGIIHLEINTNGIKLAESVDYCRELLNAGTATIYLQFDGVSPRPYIEARGSNLLPIKLRAIENLRKAGFTSICLVPTLVKGVNDDQIGDIVKFAIKNKDVIRAVNFQPVSITGRISKEKREKMRITIPEMMRKLEEQSDGLVKENDWFPVPVVQPISEFLSWIQNEDYVDFCAHPHCGMGTYLVIDEDDVIPITDYLNVDKTVNAFKQALLQRENGNELTAKLEAAKGVISNIKFKLFKRYMNDLIKYGNYKSLDRLHGRLIMLGSMHFMDPYNFDLERVQRCVIHYATPDGRIIPFCSMNNFHRTKIEKKFAEQITDKNITPLYDVNALINKILAEEKTRPYSQVINLLQTIPSKDID